MTLPPVIPIIFLVLGALAIGASELARLRRPTVILLITTLLALAALWTLRNAAWPVTQIIAAWQPISVFTVPLSFRVDETAWLLAMSLLLVLLTAGLTWTAYPGQHRPGPRAVALLLTAAALGGIFASNLLTLAVAWGMLDLAFVVALLVRGGSEVGRRAALAIVVNTASTVCVWIAALLIENQQGSLYWHLFNAPEDARAWLMAAAVLRVGLYPFHQWMPVELGKEPDRAVIIFIMPTAAGLALWVRMSIAQALPAESIVSLLAVLSLVVGALLAWRSAQARSGLPFIALCLTGSVALLAVGGATSAQLTAATLSWMFTSVSLFIARGLDRRQPYWSIGSLIAFLSLAALPGTLGFVMQQGIMTSVVDQEEWLILIAVVLAQIGALAAALRLLLSSATESAPTHVLRQIAWGLALACGALPLLSLALSDNMLPDLPPTSELLGQLTPIGVLALFGPLVIGAVVAWRGPVITRGTSDGGQSIWGRILRLDWVNTALFYLIDRLTVLLRATAGLFEGEGGLLWAVIVIVVVVVIYTTAL